MPTLRQLEYLVTVAELGSFTRAAAVLHVSQPSLSSQILVLEREVGGSLLERLPRSVRLTPAGRALVPHARAALKEARRSMIVARQNIGLESGELDVATVYSATLGLLPAPLRHFRLTHPGIELRLREYRHGDDLARAMRAGDADVAVGPTPLEWVGNLTDLGHEELVIVVASNDPLAQSRGPIDLSVLADRAWVHFAPGHGLADLLDDACASAGFRPRIALRTEQTASAPLLAAAGLGPTMVPASMIPEKFDGLIIATSPPTRRSVAIYSRLGADPATLALSQLFAAEIEVMPTHVATRLHQTPSTDPTRLENTL
jgi:DNA-binding transcriptional LysR family regulator